MPAIDATDLKLEDIIDVDRLCNTSAVDCALNIKDREAHIEEILVSENPTVEAEALILSVLLPSLATVLKSSACFGAPSGQIDENHPHSVASSSSSSQHGTKRKEPESSEVPPRKRRKIVNGPRAVTHARDCTWPQCDVRDVPAVNDMWAHVQTHEPLLRHTGPEIEPEVRCVWNCHKEGSVGTVRDVVEHMRQVHAPRRLNRTRTQETIVKASEPCWCPHAECVQGRMLGHSASTKATSSWQEFPRHCQSVHWLCGHEVEFCEVCGGTHRKDAFHKRMMLEKCLKNLLKTRSFQSGDRETLLAEKDERAMYAKQPSYRA
ncbi:hypothetical protein POSPLADRAFT_1155435 [Postia placenta MAD-698-R-SB12]|uniref:Uncharacterized protein n=1 Tax=Postia placenta MAD-698-R-SB12 TaxID=670580 RepID=A0A1X6MP96_9APHY|nr:hypothetical protein POSPLADRAFT_1155435 [Postia placenta MAD-698-R-SB12]OSX57953.1 hypothetical protein POSPLADRAFT_1155435 [Postia placenta MAD-698-R-SB12]